ncbi:hypothetical protein OD91_0013 [Lutibacter sp. Hel_I_33_5]|uniref:DUF6048 family protein n=1 Tax=Lutibacter sp. Hel_I_33_5 TaxID=1566289 RepID=UPI0011A2F87E|nr:DUF6048 family protein [Lutibacter sp. Hel_I_33_5]TVZ54778.1 hypothetical protein OD91_0013 [Lutibacter sp. Hel_I_33_5]
MYKYFISVLLLFVFANSFSQEEKNDTIVYKTSYGLRVGVDLSKPLKGAIQGNSNGLELVGDYRITKRWFIAAELGYEEETSSEDFSNSTAKGSYMRLGMNYNAYNNWLDMNNEIYVGFRYGLSLFDQTINSYTPNVVTGEANTLPYFPADLVTTPITETGLNAHWTEFIIGVKAETFKNLFLGFSLSYKVLVSVKDQQNFKSLYAPGFNRIFQSDTGFGFNYTLSYTIPFQKK